MSSYYWQRVHIAFDILLEYDAMLKDGFWPMSRVHHGLKIISQRKLTFEMNLMKMSILLAWLEIVLQTPFKSMKICMMDILWQFVRPKIINNILHGLQGLYQI